MKTFVNFKLFAKVFSTKFGGVVSFDSTGKQCKNCIFQQFAKVFSLESFSPVYSSCMLAPTLLSRSQLVAIVTAGRLLRIHSSHSSNLKLVDLSRLEFIKKSVIGYHRTRDNIPNVTLGILSLIGPVSIGVV